MFSKSLSNTIKRLSITPTSWIKRGAKLIVLKLFPCNKPIETTRARKIILDNAKKKSFQYLQRNVSAEMPREFTKFTQNHHWKVLGSQSQLAIKNPFFILLILKLLAFFVTWKSKHNGYAQYVTMWNLAILLLVLILF